MTGRQLQLPPPPRGSQLGACDLSEKQKEEKGEARSVVRPCRGKPAVFCPCAIAAASQAICTFLACLPAPSGANHFIAHPSAIPIPCFSSGPPLRWQQERLGRGDLGRQGSWHKQHACSCGCTEGGDPAPRETRGTGPGHKDGIQMPRT